MEIPTLGPSMGCPKSIGNSPGPLQRCSLRSVYAFRQSTECCVGYRAAGPASWCSKPSIAVPNFAQSPCCIAFRASSSCILACSKPG